MIFIFHRETLDEDINIYIYILIFLMIRLYVTLIPLYYRVKTMIAVYDQANKYQV